MNRPSFFQRIVRFFITVVCVIAFCAAAFYTALQTESLRPAALNLSSKATVVWKAMTAPDSAAAETVLASANFVDNVPAGDQSSDSVTNTVETIELAKADASTVTRTFTGVMTPGQSSDLGFKRIDRIKSVLVDQGDTVKAGDTLAELETRSLVAQRSVLEADLRSAKARLQELEAGPREQTIAAARAKLTELQSMVDLANITSARRSRLAADNAVSQQEVDNARLQMAAAESRYQSQLQVLRELEAGTRKEQIEAQRGMIQKLEASLQSLDISIDESILKAPFDAMVSKRMADEGMIVAPGATIMRLVQQNSPEAWIGLPPNVASQLDSDQEFSVIIDGKPIAATLKSVLPELDPLTRTQTAVFVVDLDNSSPQFGQVTRFEWQKEQSLAGYWVPTSALTRGVRGLWSVLVAQPFGESGETGVLERRDVEVLRIETDKVLLRGTLVPGERVVANGVHKLVAGQSVNLSK